MKRKDIDKKNVKAIVEAGEVFPRDFFVKKGKEGKEKDLAESTPEERSERAKKQWKTKRSYPHKGLDK